MLQAILAALPWIFMGTAILILTLQREKRDKREKENQRKEKRKLELWTCLGMGLGALIGFLIPAVSASFCVSLGILIGITAGTFLQKKEA
ncbi:MAG: hypothetical protein IIY02_02815 [Firmicutes bacterium]|nr:hypothetical protein [Bacillota bacterium]